MKWFSFPIDPAGDNVRDVLAYLDPERLEGQKGRRVVGLDRRMPVAGRRSPVAALSGVRVWMDPAEKNGLGGLVAAYSEDITDPEQTGFSFPVVRRPMPGEYLKPNGGGVDWKTFEKDKRKWLQEMETLHGWQSSKNSPEN